ncbi:MAG: hypothetical protein KAT43_06165 [Nanoarchaeota archaeon]|nr:hypothetical protein [Nanoarchaeota archaeon]
MKRRGFKRYMFIGKKPVAGLHLQIPYGEEVELVFWGPRRKVVVKRPNGEMVITMGYYLRKIKKEGSR